MKNFEVNKCLIWCFVVFVLAFSIRLYYFSKKQGLHIDEALTASITSCQYDKYLDFYPGNVKSYTGKELKDLFTPKNQGFEDTVSDLKMLRYKNCGDYAHPNLPYMIFKIFTYPVQQFDRHNLILYGGVLNLIFFSLSFFVLYKILQELFADNKELIPLGLAVAFLNTGSISISLFIRSYEMQTFCILFLSYVFLLIYKNYKTKGLDFSLKNTILFVLASLLCILTAYFVAIYWAIVAASLFLLLIKQRDSKKLLMFLSLILFIGLMTFVCYPSYLSGLHHYRADQIYDLFGNVNHFVNIYNSLFYWLLILRYFLFYIPVFILMILALFFIEKKNQYRFTNFYVLLMIACVWMTLVMFLAPQKILRYIAPVFPLLGLIIPLLVANLRKNLRLIFIVLFSLNYIYYAFAAKNVEWYVAFRPPVKSEKAEFMTDLFSSHIENLYIYNTNLPAKADLPVLYVTSVLCDYVNVVYFFNDNQIYEFYFFPYSKEPQTASSDGTLERKLRQYKKYYLILGYTLVEDPSDFGVKHLMFPCFDVERQLGSAIKSKEYFELNNVYKVDFTDQK